MTNDERRMTIKDNQATQQPNPSPSRTLTPSPPHPFTAWAARMLLALSAALGAGALAYGVARAVASAVLFFDQQRFFSEVAGTVRGGVEGLANSGDLRAARLRVQALQAQYEQISLIVAFGVAAVMVVAVYVWLERRAAREAQEPL